MRICPEGGCKGAGPPCPPLLPRFTTVDITAFACPEEPKGCGTWIGREEGCPREAPTPHPPVPRCTAVKRSLEISSLAGSEQTSRFGNLDVSSATLPRGSKGDVVSEAFSRFTLLCGDPAAFSSRHHSSMACTLRLARVGISSKATSESSMKARSLVPSKPSSASTASYLCKFHWTSSACTSSDAAGAAAMFAGHRSFLGTDKIRRQNRLFRKVARGSGCCRSLGLRSSRGLRVEGCLRVLIILGDISLWVDVP